MGSEPSSSSRFFVLEGGVLGSRYDADADTVEPINRAEAPRCARCGSFIGMLKWMPPYRVKLELNGEEPGDYIKKSAYELLISERFAEAFRSEGLTGLTGFQPVEVVQVRRMNKRPGKSLTVPTYLVVSTCFGHASVDPMLNRMRISAPPTCSECRLMEVDAIHGFVLEPGTWQGEDVFRPRGLVGDLVVRAAEVAQTSEISGSFWQIGRTQRETAMVPGAIYAP